MQSGQIETNHPMNPFQGLKLSPVECLALKPLLEGKLLEATNLASQTLSLPESDIAGGAGVVAVTSGMIPLHRAKDTRCVLYLCAIAFKLEKIWQRPAMDIASAIRDLAIDSLYAASPTDELPLLNFGGLDFTIAVVPPGWIHLQLTATGEASWLQSLTQGVGCAGEGRGLIAERAGLFAVQYAHARCCSLLGLAHRDRLITLSEQNLEATQPVFCLLVPDPIPWLDSDGQYRWVHPSERQLISQLVDTLDAIYFLSRKIPNTTALQLATRLSQDFLTFYNFCRIWGEVKIETPSLAQARLGLILATQKVLQLLLNEYLGALAPQEL